MVVEEKRDEARTDQASAPAVPAHRPFWPVALLLLGLIAAVLGAAFLLDRAYRPPVGVVAAPTPLAAGRPTGVPTAAVRATAPPVPTPMAAPAPTVTAAPTLVPTQTTAPASAAAATPVVSPTATARLESLNPEALATMGPALERLPPLQRQVADAYLRFWDVRIRAFSTLDGSRLSEVMAGDELAREERHLQELRSRGRAISVEIDHSFQILRASPDDALIYDEYVNRSVSIDAATRQSLSTDAPTLEKISYQLRRIDGVWKVVDVARHQ